MLKTYADRIKYAMELKNISQSELARRTNLNKGAISSYLNGRYNPKQDAIYLLSNALSVSEIWLMGLVEDMSTSNEEFEKDRNISKVEFIKDLDLAHWLGNLLNNDDPDIHELLKIISTLDTDEIKTLLVMARALKK